MAAPLGNSVFFRNKEMMSQCNGQNPEPVVVENLVIHFDQEKFEELLSGGSPVLHTWKHKKVSMGQGFSGYRRETNLYQASNWTNLVPAPLNLNRS